MSFVDLATLTIHRRNELETRLKVFYDKCDTAIDNIIKLKEKSQGFIGQLNCDPSVLKDRFLSCMKQLDEYTYLITDFNLAISKIDEIGQSEYTPVHDLVKPLIPTNIGPFNLMDALSEPAPSTSTTCPNKCPPQKPKRLKTPKEDQLLIVFSSSSSSEETIAKKYETTIQQKQCELEDELSNVKIEDPLSSEMIECTNLPAQTILEIDQVYEAVIMHIDGAFFWIITEDPDELHMLMVDMRKYYTENYKQINKDDVTALTCCACFDEDTDSYYRALFLKLTEDDSDMASMFMVDTGELRSVPVQCVQPLYARFCVKPPYARCCHLAGIDLNTYHHKPNMMDKLEAFMTTYKGTQCNIEIDDNTSESLEVYVVLFSGEILNNIIVEQNLALPIDKQDDSPQSKPSRERCTPAASCDSEHDNILSECPEYDDPVEAVTGYSNRDEADICKHYKGGPEKTCFKGKRCTKRHIVIHPDGWTLDRMGVNVKCKSVPLPAPGTWHKVVMTWVCHYDRIYVHLLGEKNDDHVRDEPPPPFGVVVPPRTLPALIQDMNSPATVIAYKPLKTIPGPGEMVAALYPTDGNWYRARVFTVTPSDQSVEVMYVDYGTVLWLKQDQLRALEPRHVALPAQAVRCVLAGVRARTRRSPDWAHAKRALAHLLQRGPLDAHVVARGYDEITVELYDQEGYSITEQLAAKSMVDLVHYEVVEDSATTQKVVVP